ncbi:MAG: KGGVGR-motif variant AAA ATPase [Gaiellaceae bacterium]
MTENAAPRGGGTVCTFYSYKGGVGRTLALANVAVLLSQWGYRVLCIDWDLEAPGLHLYFERYTTGAPRPGVVELIERLRDGTPFQWRDHVTTVEAPGTGSRLQIITAGAFDDSYFARMQALDWLQLYEESDLGELLEALRYQWTQDFEFVLIDSRTGVTDAGGICTVQLPHVVAFLLTPNRQSVDGSLDIMHRAEEERAKLPVDRPRLLLLPVVTRWEANVEVDLSREWLARLHEELAPTVANWAHKSLSPGALLNHARLPYVPRWSFGEELPVVEEGTGDQLSLGYAIETLAALIANRLENTDLLIANRQSYVDAAQLAKVTEGDRYAFDLEIWTQRGGAAFATRIAERLTSGGWRVRETTTVEPTGEREGTSGLAARNLVVVLSEVPTPWLERQVREFLRSTLLEEEDSRLLIPITRAPAAEVLPRSLRSLRFIDANNRTINDVVAELVVRLELQRAEGLEALLGRDHQAAVSARSRYVVALLDTGEIAEATVLLGSALRDAKAVLGERHELTRTLREKAAAADVEIEALEAEEGLAETAPEAEDDEFFRSDETPATGGRSIRGAEGARLIALNMALNGTPRDETARYLAENFDLDDREALLEEVYARVGG